MSQINVDNIKNRTGGAIGAPSGAVVTGVTTTGSIIVGAAVTINASGIDAGTGIITATNGIRIGAGKSIGSDGADAVFYGDGSNLTGVISGIELESEGNSVGTGITNINFVGFSSVTAPDSAGLSTITVAGWEQRDTWLYGGG